MNPPPPDPRWLWGWAATIQLVRNNIKSPQAAVVMCPCALPQRTVTCALATQHTLAAATMMVAAWMQHLAPSNKHQVSYPQGTGVCAWPACASLLQQCRLLRRQHKVVTVQQLKRRCQLRQMGHTQNRPPKQPHPAPAGSCRANTSEEHTQAFTHHQTLTHHYINTPRQMDSSTTCQLLLLLQACWKPLCANS